MASLINYAWELITYSLTLPFRVLGYRISAGVWLRYTKEHVNPKYAPKVGIYGGTLKVYHNRTTA